VLLLTATVTPSSEVARLVITNPNERLAEYVAGFRAALALVPETADGLVLAENSGADLSVFREIAGGRTDVELLHVPSRTAGPGAGRGYHETLLVADAFERSALLRAPGATAWKVTGRYQVRNLRTVIRRGPHGFDLVVNLRGFPRRWADMRVYSATAAGAAMLVQHVDELREDRAGLAPEDALPPEPAVFDILSQFCADGASVAPRLASEPYVVGRRGYDGSSFEGPKQWLLWGLRSAARRGAPGLWL